MNTISAENMRRYEGLRQLRSPSLRTATFISVELCIVGVALAILVGQVPAQQQASVAASFLISSLVSIPFLAWCYRTVDSPLIKLALLAWLPFRALLLWTAPAENIAFTTGDWEVLHGVSVDIARYWAQGGSVIPDSQFLTDYSVKYPGIILLFGVPYLVFGFNGYVIVPWLAFVQVLTGIAAYRLVAATGKSKGYSEAALAYMLFCPAWLALTNQLFRDILLVFALIIFASGLLRLRQQVTSAGLATIACGVILTILLRSQYLFILVGFAIIALGIGRFRPLRVLGFALTITVVVGYLQLGYFAEDKQPLEFTQSQVGETVNVYGGEESSLVARFGDITPATAAFSIPFRTLVGIVAPFPWWNSESSLSDRTGKWWVYALFHIVQAFIHLALLICVLVALFNRRLRQLLTTNEKLSITFGLILTMAGALAYVGFNRNLLPAFPFLLPGAFAVGRPAFIRFVGVSVAITAALHLGYSLLR